MPLYRGTIDEIVSFIVRSTWELNYEICTLEYIYFDSMIHYLFKLTFNPWDLFPDWHINLTLTVTKYNLNTVSKTSGSHLGGHRWPSGDALARAIASYHWGDRVTTTDFQKGVFPLPSLPCIELGAGVGTVGLTAAMCGFRWAVIWEHDPPTFWKVLMN
jgi:hypothetical protein